MIDFRYHALSLVAVFVALLIGLLLGVAIGDRGLVSSAEQNLRADLRADLRESQAEVTDLRGELDRHRRYEELTLPKLVGDRLAGRRVVLLFLDERSDGIFDDVRAAVESAGGRLALVGALDGPIDLGAVAGAAEGTRFARLADDPGLLDDLGRRLGQQMVEGGPLLERLRESLLATSSGSAEPASAVVLVRSPEGSLEGEEAENAGAFVDGLLEGVLTAGAAVAGVEQQSTDPSQVPWYREHGLPSVDNVDEVAGHASLAVILAGEAEGAYGVKSTRDAYIPDELVAAP